MNDDDSDAEQVVMQSRYVRGANDDAELEKLVRLSPTHSTAHQEMKNPYLQKRSKRSKSGEKLFSDTDEDEIKRVVPPVKKVMGLFN